MEFTLRDERAADRAAIRSLTEQAFRGKPYAGGDEQDVIDRLRLAEGLSLSIVAIVAEAVVGHAAFSPSTAEDGSSPWFALGPVSVVPHLQGEGIGGALINAGLERLAQMDALGCMLTGDPLYYRRFGFEVMPSHCPENEPREYFQLKLLAGQTPSGRLHFHPAFYDD